MNHTKPSSESGAKLLATALTLTAILATAASADDARPRYFPSPETAVEELVAAARSGERDAVVAVLGAGSARLLDSGDDVADREGRKRFVARFEEGHAIRRDGDDLARFDVGNDDWPFPIPLVKEPDGWRYDVAAGEDELLSRRIGENELSTVQVCLAIVDAQREYFLRNPTGADLPHYARRFHSDAGKRNGLYWPTAEGEEPSPLGPFVATAASEGYSYAEAAEEPQPYHGYYFRLLTRQGPDAPGGAYDYLVRDVLLGGFAVVAYPAEYGISGITTFAVNHDGVVFQSDLGPDTPKLAPEIAVFNPDTDWTRVEAEEP